jgi:uncharacterized membrane protein YgcG
MKRILLIFLLLIGIPASANVAITEIMYDLPGADTGREWVEVQNVSDGEIDLTTYKFFEANTNHKINAHQGGSNLAAGAYAIIADNAEKFLTDWPGFAGIIFDSAFSLSNTGETLALKDADGNTVNEVTYSSEAGAAGDGKSLSLVGGSFVPRNPTPGLPNAENNDDDDGGSGGGGDAGGGGSGGGDGSSGGSDDDGGGGSQVNNNTQPVKQTTPKVYPYAAKIIAPTNAFVKVPVTFEVKVTGQTKEEVLYGRFVWNLGDFTAREDASRQKFTHTYDWPGEYVVVFDYYKSGSSQPEASDRLVVKVAAAAVEITNVGLPPDVFVELTNASSREMDLSSFVLSQNDRHFYIPNNTIILPNKKIVLPARITGFLDASPVALFYPNQEIASIWPNPKVLPPPPPPPSLPTVASVAKESPPPPPAEIQFVPETSPPNLLAAGVSQSGFNFGKIWLWLLGALGLAGLGVAVVLLMKDDKDDEEFTLLE